LHTTFSVIFFANQSHPWLMQLQADLF
jgi:hypothetical protein